MSPEVPSLPDGALAAILRALRSHKEPRPLVVGMCGAQGSGKSTLAAQLARALEARTIPTAIVSIDDLYKTRAERQRLATNVHPLLLTRGVPGTHDVALGLRLVDALDSGEAVPIPRFDKAIDDRLPHDRWDRAAPRVGIVIFEGWCVGARPQRAAELERPINALERNDDPKGIWRAFANQALATEYQSLFARIDMMILLAAPRFEIVQHWRIQQEQELRHTAIPEGRGVMSDAQLVRFIQHYERLTRHILFEMPERADVVAELADDRTVRHWIVR